VRSDKSIATHLSRLLGYAITKEFIIKVRSSMGLFRTARQPDKNVYGSTSIRRLRLWKNGEVIYEANIAVVEVAHYTHVLKSRQYIYLTVVSLLAKPYYVGVGPSYGAARKELIGRLRKYLGRTARKD
jgi:hypothetical protein